ncbi:MAG: polymer-forming cytoskeletal protein [Bacteroidota bacterium]
MNNFDSILNFHKKEILPITILSDSLIWGNMYSAKSIRIEGIFEGNIYSKNKIIVDDNASIKGDIIANDIDISGKVVGSIFCANKVNLKNGAKVVGSIYAYTFKNEAGSVFNNQLNLFNEKNFKAIQLLMDEINPNEGFFESSYLKKIKSYIKSEVNINF